MKKKAALPRPMHSSLLYVPVGLMIGLLAFLLFTYVPLFRQIELNTLDLRYRKRPTIHTSPRLGTIDIDEEMIAVAGSWPISRRFYGEFMRVLHKYDASLMSLDVLFPDPSALIIPPDQIEKVVLELT